MSAAPRGPSPLRGSGAGVAPRRRSWWDIRWRQFRNAPRPVVRAVGANLAIAIVLGLAYFAYDVALTRGARLPGGDLRALLVALDVVLVLGLGSLITYLIVPLPRGAGERATQDRLERGPWPVRGGADRLSRARRGEPDPRAAADLSGSRMQHRCDGGPSVPLGKRSGQALSWRRSRPW